MFSPQLPLSGKQLFKWLLTIGIQKAHGFLCWGCHKISQGAETIEVHLLTILEARSLRSKQGQVWFLLRPRSSTSRCLPSPCDLTGLSVYDVASLGNLPLLRRKPILWDSSLSFIPSFDLNYLLNSPISKCNHIGYEGLNIWTWGWGAVQSLTLNHLFNMLRSP